MSDVHLEKFQTDIFEAFVQAKDLRQLVRLEADQLNVTNPGAVARYGQSWLRAARQLRRVAESTEVNAYLVRYNRAVRGIATIIPDQTIVFDGRSLNGSDLDYWIEHQRTGSIHLDVAEAVSAKAEQLDRTAVQFATIDSEGSQHYGCEGFRSFSQFRLAAADVILATPLGDPYDIARAGIPVDLFVREPSRRSVDT